MRFILLLLCAVGVNCNGDQTMLTDESAKELIANCVRKSIPLCKEASLHGFNYRTNLTAENQNRTIAASRAESAQWDDCRRQVAKSNWSLVKDNDTLRQLDIIYTVGVDALDENEKDRISDCVIGMIETWSTTKIEPFGPKQPKAGDPDPSTRDKERLALSPDIEEILADPDATFEEKEYVTYEWMGKVGQKGQKCFKTYVDLANKAAKLNELDDYGVYMRNIYGSRDLKCEVDKIWDQIKHLYQHLHAYVRRKLSVKYGNDKVSTVGPMPCHIFGTLFGQTWNNIYEFTAPFPNADLLDIDQVLKNNNYTVEQLYRDANNIFVEMGMISVPDTFWSKSMFIKPLNVNVVCQPSAWDMCDGLDYRITRCSRVSHADYIGAYELMGMVQYSMQYKDQPFIFQDSANPAFFNVIGSLISMTGTTTKHLKKLKLIKVDWEQNENDTLNVLFREALDRVSFLPFGLIVDRWRWDIFAGDILERNWNSEWWRMTYKYQGCVPTVQRQFNDLDALAKYHVAGNAPYITYFIAVIIRYQIYAHLCEVAGQKGPLHECDFSQSKAAGKVLSKAMSLGSSTPWPKVLEILTGKPEMDAGPLLEYFKPLLEFLVKRNAKNNEEIGW